MPGGRYALHLWERQSHELLPAGGGHAEGRGKAAGHHNRSEGRFHPSPDHWNRIVFRFSHAAFRIGRIRFDEDDCRDR